MNDKERYKIMIESRYILEKLNAYKTVIATHADLEEKKMEHISEELASSKGLDESFNSLDNLKGTIEDTIDSIEDALAELDITIRQERGRRIDTTLLDAPISLERSKENRSVRLQFLVTPTSEAILKAYCKKHNLAMNEVINRFIQTLDIES